MYSAKAGETPLDDLSGGKIRISAITRAQIDAAEAENIQRAVLRYIYPKCIREFDVSFYRKLHKQMFGQVWEWAGEYRTTGTNIGSLRVQILQDLIILQKDLEVREAEFGTAV